MDRANCSGDFANDRVMLYDRVPVPCQTPVSSFIVVGVVLCSLRLLLAMLMTAQYFNTVNPKNKPPISLFIFWTTAVFYLGFFTSVGLDQANVTNGVPAACYGYGFFCFGVVANLYYLKLVSLGGKISNVKIFDNGTLSKLNTVGKSMFVFGGTALFLQTISFCIFALVFPNNFTVIRLGFAFDMLFVLAQGSSVLYQFQRVKYSISNTQSLSRELMTTSDTKDNDSRIQTVLRKLTRHQLVFLFCEGVGAVMYLLLVIGILPAYWYVIVVLMTMEVLAAFATVVKTKRKPVVIKKVHLKS